MLVIRRPRISQVGAPFRVSPCTDNTLRDRKTRSRRSIGTRGPGNFLPLRARPLRIDSPFAKSSGIREDREFHRFVFPICRTHATRAFQRDRLRQRSKRPQFSTTAAPFRVHRDGKFGEVCFEESLLASEEDRKRPFARMLGR